VQRRISGDLLQCSVIFDSFRLFVGDLWAVFGQKTSPANCALSSWL